MIRPRRIPFRAWAAAKTPSWCAAIREHGVEAYPGSVAYVRAVRAAGLERAVVSSSSNCREVLEAAGIVDLFQDVVDGVVAEHEHLSGKPAARHLPGRGPASGRRHRPPAAVFEDALAGVAAGRAGRFGWVVGRRPGRPGRGAGRPRRRPGGQRPSRVAGRRGGA